MTQLCATDRFHGVKHVPYSGSAFTSAAQTVQINPVSYRLYSRSCLNLRTCFSKVLIKPFLVRTFLQHPTPIFSMSFPVNHMALPHPHASGNFQRSFKDLSASRWPKFRGGGWSHNQEFTRSGILMDLSHSHNDVALAVWGWKNAKRKTNELQFVESLCFAWKPAGIFPLTSFYPLQPQSAQKLWAGSGGLWIICSSSISLSSTGADYWKQQSENSRPSFTSS